jgi:tRNA threonylcarbamoyl adenosine modification protein YeaZ
MGAGSVKVLAFDCSTAQGSLAVVEDGAAIFAETFECPRGRGGAFFLVLERAIKATGHPDRIAVGIGPGSYNGLRTAIAAAEGLRLATGAELVGVASVRALPCETAEYVAVNDARGGVFYHVRIRNRGIAGEFELLTAEALAARLGENPGLPVLASAAVAAIPQARVAFPDAVILAGLAIEAPPVVGAVEPLYLKPAHITLPKRTGLLPRGK